MEHGDNMTYEQPDTPLGPFIEDAHDTNLDAATINSSTDPQDEETLQEDMVSTPSQPFSGSLTVMDHPLDEALESLLLEPAQSSDSITPINGAQPGTKLLKQFEVKEQLDKEWNNALVRLPLKTNHRSEELRLISLSPERREITFQIYAGEIYFIINSLSALETKNYNLYHIPQKTETNKLPDIGSSVKNENAFLLSNDLIAVTVPYYAQISNPIVATTGPILKIEDKTRTPTKKFGGSEFFGYDGTQKNNQIKLKDSSVLSNGKVFCKVRLEYEFTSGSSLLPTHTLVLTATLYARDNHIFWESELKTQGGKHHEISAFRKMGWRLVISDSLDDLQIQVYSKGTARLSAQNDIEARLEKRNAHGVLEHHTDDSSWINLLASKKSGTKGDIKPNVSQPVLYLSPFNDWWDPKQTTKLRFFDQSNFDFKAKPFFTLQSWDAQAWVKPQCH